MYGGGSVECPSAGGAFTIGQQRSAPPNPKTKAAKNTGPPQKNSFFCEKTALVFFFVFFALFARAMCGAGEGVLVEFLRLQRKTSPIFLEFPPLSSSVPEVLGP
jgi:hypothetical protein